MAGGQGSRLKPATHIVPKPLIPIGDTPIIEILVKQLQKRCFDNIVVTLNYKPGMIRTVLNRYDLNYYEEDEPLGTLGCLPFLDLEDTFLVIHADVLSTINYRRVYEYQHFSDSIATIGVVQQKEKIHLGVVDLSEDGDVVDFREKPLYHFKAFMGVSAYSKRILDFIPKGKAFGLDDMIYSLLDAEERIQGFLFNGLYFDVGRPDLYEKAARRYLKDPAVFGVDNETA